MSQKITLNDLRKWQANPPEKRFYVRDSLSKLQARVNIDGTVSFVARRRRTNGKREWKTFGTWPEVGLADARTMADEFVAGVQVVTKKDEAANLTTWGDVVDGYLEEARLKNKSWKNQEHLLTKYPPRTWKLRPADSITKAEIRALLLSIGAKAPYQANRLHLTISAAFNRAIENDLLEVNPIRTLKKLFKEKARKNLLSFDQIRTLWHVCDEHPYPASKAIQLLLLTGARRGEILSARWDALGEDRWLEIPENKADRPHKIYLCDLAMEVVDSLESRGVSDFLFPGPDPSKPTGDIKMAKRTIQKQADIGEWQLRDLRATFMSYCIEHCETLPIIAQVCANHELQGVSDQNYIFRLSYYKSCKRAWIAYGRLIAGIVRGRVGHVVSLHEGSRAAAQA